MINVKDAPYNAVGNGIANDRKAIQDAIDNAGGDLGIYFPTGNYLIKSAGTPGGALLLRDGGHLYGDGYASQITLDAALTNTNLLQQAASPTTFGSVLIEKLRLVGNKTSSGATNGNGIYLANCNKATIQNCSLSLFGGNANGLGTTGAAIRIDAGTEILIDGNLFDGGTGVGDTADILLAGTTGFATITNNKCYSVNGHGIYVNYSSTSAGKIVIGNNVCKDKGSYGIRPTTDVQTPPPYLDTIVSNNLVVNCAAGGILMDSGTTFPVGGGTLTIIGNIVDACGGSLSNGLAAGILVRVGHPALLANNYVYHAGYDSGGNARANGTYGIKVYDCLSEVLVDGNLIEKCKDGGITVETMLDRCSIKNNTLLDNLGFQIRLGLSSTGSGFSQFLEVVGNKLQLVSSGSAVAGLILGGLASPITRVNIANNSFLGRKNTSPVNRGIDATIGKFNGLIQGNLFDNWDEAVNLEGTSSELQQPKLLFANNVLSNSTIGVKHSLTTINAPFGFILNNFFDGTTTDISPASTSQYGVKHVMGIVAVTSQASKRIFFDAGLPATGVTGWTTGDTVYFTSPVANGRIGGVYTSTAWKQFGPIDLL
jgi:hypothetical protein